MIILGMVGTPAGGKSTAAEFLAGLGAEWINADLIARSCLNLPEVIDILAGRFGSAILGNDGSVDRKTVADLVFGDDSVSRGNLQFLESQVLPRTRTEMHRRIVEAAHQDRVVALLDAPLLFESGWDRGCDAIWCVDASRENRLARCKKRGWDAGELDRREAKQIAIETKSRLSNVVMRNDSTLDALHENLRRSWDDLVRINDVGAVRSEFAGPPHCSSDRVPK
ncbi:MAG: dephospho-CoA kinase [Planctomycetales bacterium]|nr:dephospho-CoA kinase [Planctomycetales bacterium]